MTRLLVLGADGGRESAFATWAADGIAVTLVDGDSSRYWSQVDRYLPLHVRDGRADLDVLARVASRHDGVLTLSDTSQRSAAALAARLGWRGPGTRAAELARSKLAQRKLAAREHHDGPAFADVAGAEDLRAFFAARPGRAVLKPTDGAGSTGVTIVDGAAEAIDALPLVSSYSTDGTCLIEAFVTGEEFSVEAVVFCGGLVRWHTTRKLLGGPSGVIETGHTVVQRETEQDSGTVASALLRLISSWQVEDAIVHAEYRRQASGELILIEAAVRPPGDHVPDLTRLATGIDLYRDLASLSLGEAPGLPGDPSANCAGIRFVVERGTVRALATAEHTVADLPSVKVAVQLAQPGRRVRSIPGSWARCGFVLGWDDDLQRLDDELGLATERLAVAMGLRRTLTPPEPSGEAADGPAGGRTTGTERRHDR